jgi:hypothetical protein
MEQLSTLSQTIMGLNKIEQIIFRAKFALRKCIPDKKLIHRKYKLILLTDMRGRLIPDIHRLGQHSVRLLPSDGKMSTGCTKPGVIKT